MKILLVDLPSHIPTVPPYSVTALKAAIDGQIRCDAEIMDLNAWYHKTLFPDSYSKDKNVIEKITYLLPHLRESYRKTSYSVIRGKKAPLQDEMLGQIHKKNPEIVCFSLIYNTQVFFAKGIIEELQKKGIRVYIGGPADKSMLPGIRLKDAKELITHILTRDPDKKKENYQTFPLDFSPFNKSDYITDDIIYPIRTALSCPYQKCAFCTHHDGPYHPLKLDTVVSAIKKNNMKKICFIDDDIPPPRLKKLSKAIGSLGVEWWCQLRPQKEHLEMMPELYGTGLRAVVWGIESGSRRVLDLMEKGTTPEVNKKVLFAAHDTGIKNIVYVMFGFPGETEKDAEETLFFLEKNSKSIDLASPSVFGLQKNSKVYMDPERFGIDSIEEHKRTLLSERITYHIVKGMSNSEALSFKRRAMPRLDAISNLPKILRSCKEQILNL